MIRSLRPRKKPRCNPTLHSGLERLEDRTMFSTYVVTNLADHGTGSLRQAILNADAHAGTDTITFAAGLHGTIPLTSGQTVITGSVSITGPGAALLSVSGNNASRVFEVTGSTTAVSISGLTITRGNAGLAFGGGILNYGIVTLASDVVSDNAAASLDIGGVYGGGAGLMNYGKTAITGSTFKSNAVYAHDDTLFEGGGGIYNRGTLTLTNSVVTDNSASLSPAATVLASASGGGIFNTGSATIAATTISGNHVTDSGGGLENNGGTMTLSNCTISQNAWVAVSTENDGGIGGGILNWAGTLKISDSTLWGNTASNGGGGGFENDATMTMVGCTLYDNSAADFGGGGDEDAGELTVINSTFYGNKAGSGAGLDCGGELSPAPIVFDDDTISGNTATGFDQFGDPTGAGGGIATQDPITLNNTVVAGNFANGFAPDAVSEGNNGVVATFSGSHNLIGENANGLMVGLSNGVNGNQVGTQALPINPLLAPLGNYGGPTETMPPLYHSPVIDHGSNASLPAGLTTDQRGLTRIVGSTVDIGADEAQATVKVAFPNAVSGGTVNVPIAALTVVVEDASGNIATTNNSSVTLSLASGPAGAKINGSTNGTVSASIVDGVALFKKLSFTKAGVYTLKAVDGTLSSAISKFFTIVL